MHDIRVSIVSAEAADHGVAELWAVDELIGYTILEDGDLMLRIEPRRDRTAVVLGVHSLARALSQAKRQLEQYGRGERPAEPLTRADAEPGEDLAPRDATRVRHRMRLVTL